MAKEKQKLSSYIEIDDNTPMIKLSIRDQMRVILNKMAHDDARELDNEDEFAISEAKRRANLEDFLRKATKPLREGVHTSVSLRISSEFDDILKDVLESPQISRYYTVKMVRPEVDYNVHFNILVRLEVRQD